jgi:hypothetical protein
MARTVAMTGIVLTLAVGTVLFFPIFDGSALLVLTSQESGEIIAQQEIAGGEVVTFNWIHSFELIPWHEEYTIEPDGSFVLHTISVAGFGAGIPANKGVTDVIDGMVVMHSIEERFDRFSWIHSQTALTSITVDDRIFIHGSDVEHHLPVELWVKGTQSVWQRFRWTR